MTADLTNPVFTDEAKAREYLESVRWADGAYCPHCGETEQVKRLEGKSHRPGLHYCRSCRGHFSVTVGTLYERSKIPLHKWLLATHLLTSSKKGMSAHQLHRMLGITYKSAWFMAHRIREGLKVSNPSPIGGAGGIVEVDETYFGKKRERQLKVRGDGKVYREKGHGHKHAVLTLVERNGRARSFHIDSATAETVRPILVTNASRDSRLETDESKIYVKVGKEFKGGHHSVNHKAEEYVRGDHHTNTIEGFYSIFKRGMKGVYQHCSEKHLHRYLAEFDFRYSNRIALGVTDAERAALALKGIEGKRLTYRRTDA